MAGLILLPGMDGTGALFSSFVSAFGKPVQVVRYPTSEPLGYAELEALVRSELPACEPFCVLGESFSGPIAIALAASPPPQLRGVILCCTFASNPRSSLAALRGLIPFLPARPPLWALEALLCGRFANPALRVAILDALAQIPAGVLRARLAAVASVNVVPQLQSVRMPLLYLRASEDRLVPRAAAATIVSNTRDIRMVEFVAPHCLLQTVSQEAAAVVAQFMEEVGSAL